MLEEMTKKLAEFSSLTRQKQKNSGLQEIKRKTRIEEIDKEIAALLDKIALANDTVMDYLNSRISALDVEKKELYAEIAQLDEQVDCDFQEITDYMSRWEDLSISDKIIVVDCLIETITASQEKIEIKWKI